MVNGDVKIRISAWLDSISESTLISKYFSKKLKMDGKTKYLTPSNVMNMKNNFQSICVNLCLVYRTSRMSNAWVVEYLVMIP